MYYDKTIHPDSFIHLSKQGLSTMQIAKEWGISPRTIHLWAKDEKKPEFIEAYKLGNEYEEAHWEGIGWGLANGTIKGNGIVYIYSMKARFGGKWLNDGKHNTLEITTKHQNMSDEELNRMIKGYLTPIEKDITPPLIDLTSEQFEQVEIK